MCSHNVLAADVVIDVSGPKRESCGWYRQNSCSQPRQMRADQFRRRSDGPILVWAANVAVAHRSALKPLSPASVLNRQDRKEPPPHPGCQVPLQSDKAHAPRIIPHSAGTAPSSTSDFNPLVRARCLYSCIPAAVAFVDAHRWRVPRPVRTGSDCQHFPSTRGFVWSTAAPQKRLRICNSR